MTDNIVKFKGKPKAIDPANVQEWLMAYATLISEMEEKPSNIVILELFDNDKATSHNMWIAGPKMKGLSLLGLLDMARFAVAFDQLTYTDE